MEKDMVKYSQNFLFNGTELICSKKKKENDWIIKYLVERSQNKQSNARSRITNI